MFKVLLAFGAVVSAAAVYMSGVSGFDIALRFVLYLLIYTFCIILTLVLSIVAMSLFVNKSKERIKDSPAYRAMAVFALNFAFSALNVKLHFTGKEKLPKGRFLLIQNHVSMFDPLSTLCAFGKYSIGFITKPENLELPVAGGFLHKLCCIAIDRENPRNAVKSINEAAEFLNNDICSIGLYPEGTRNRGEGLLPFHNASLKIATKAGVPVVVSSVRGTDKIKGVNIFKKKDVYINICDVIPGEEVKGAPTAGISERVRKALCADLGFPFDEENEAE